MIHKCHSQLNFKIDYNIFSKARGVGSPDQAGALRNIADQARKLEPNSTVLPIIRLESDQGLEN